MVAISAGKQGKNWKKLEKYTFFPKVLETMEFIYIFFNQCWKSWKSALFIWLDMSSQQSNKSVYLLVSFSDTVSRV